MNINLLKKYFILLYLVFFTLTSIGQKQEDCYQHINPYAYGISNSYIFLDSTFRYEFVAGLSGGTVLGPYNKSGDTLILNSTYQEDDYKISKSIDSTRSISNIQLEIRTVNYKHLSIQVATLHNKKKDSTKIFLPTSVAHSNGNNFIDKIDTVNSTFEITLNTSYQNEIEIRIWRTNALLKIPIENGLNYYFIDLTSYPNVMDYHFFKDKKFLIQKENLIELNDNNKKVREKYFRKSRRGITLSKRKRLRKYKKCI